ncbi:hypothetical protein SprV_0200812800 [Sparganum proliferum]
MELFASGCLFADHQHGQNGGRPSNASNGASRSHVNGAQPKAVNDFAYSGGTLSRSITIDDEVAHRTSKARQTLDRLQNSIWNHHALHLNTNLKIYKAVVLKTVLSGAETWTVYEKRAPNLNHFYLGCLPQVRKFPNLLHSAPSTPCLDHCN